jgi:hypothetical protein
MVVVAVPTVGPTVVVGWFVVSGDEGGVGGGPGGQVDDDVKLFQGPLLTVLTVLVVLVVLKGMKDGGAMYQDVIIKVVAPAHVPQPTKNY